MKVNLTHQNQFASALLWVYQSPESETSIVKGVPMHLVPMVKSIIKDLYPTRTLSVRYRGPRPRGGYNGQSTCLKADATSASIYFQQHWDRTTRNWSY
jgi:hypothetical protein